MAILHAPANAGEPTGTWLTADQSGHIRIGACENGYWGIVDWERQPGTDDHNPDPAKRNRPMLGVPILIGMKPTSPNEWQGEIYNPEDGGFYTARISLLQPNVLRIQGCVLGIFCGGENWTRVERATTGASATRARSVCPGQPKRKN